MRTGRVTIEVSSLDPAVARAHDGVVALGGFVSGSDQSTENEQAAASVTFRVPADRSDDALAAVRDLATATRTLHVETEAVTNQVIDLGARITNLRATEGALQVIMLKVVTPEREIPRDGVVEASFVPISRRPPCAHRAPSVDPSSSASSPALSR
ncbi:MAG: DUF4349 domain-containing protein [Chloroflexota bacterium]